MFDALARLFDEVRLLEHRLVQAAEVLHADTEVSVPGRAVLEFLERSGPASVPHIARTRHVTRQHIQATVDTLADQALVQGRPNPAHRRSPLFTLTATGASAISSMHDREREFLEQRITGIDEDEVLAAVGLLATVRRALDEGEPDDHQDTAG